MDQSIDYTSCFLGYWLLLPFWMFLWQLLLPVRGVTPLVQLPGPLDGWNGHVSYFSQWNLGGTDNWLPHGCILLPTSDSPPVLSLLQDPGSTSHNDVQYWGFTQKELPNRSAQPTADFPTHNKLPSCNHTHKIHNLSISLREKFYTYFYMRLCKIKLTQSSFLSCLSTLSPCERSVMCTYPEDAWSSWWDSEPPVKTWAW